MPAQDYGTNLQNLNAANLDNAITYDINFAGRPMRLKDTMMALIGGLTWTAAHDIALDVDSRMFDGDFPGVGTKVVLLTSVRCGVITGMLYKVGIFALTHQEIRELEIIVFNGPDIMAAAALVLTDGDGMGPHSLGKGQNASIS